MSNIYLGTIDGGGDGKVLLLAAINRALNKNWTLNDFDFGEPEAVSVSSPTHNTVIPFGPKLTSGGVGVRKVYYNRIHAAELGNIIVPWNNEMFIKDLLPKINAKYGVLIQETDIIDDVVPSPPAGQSNVQVSLSFSATSIIFYSSTQIQVGLNDPTGDTVVVDPFNPSIAVAFNQTQEFELDGEQRVILEPFVFAMDRDNTRVEMSVVARTLFQDNTSARSRITMSQQTFDKLEDHLPFVGMWKNPQDNATFAITVLGDIYSMSQESKHWVFVANGLGYNTQSSSVVLSGYNDPFVKGVAQGADGSVYFLAKAQNQDPKVWKSTAAGTGWVALGISATRMKTLTASAWPTLKVLDILHSGDRLWVLLQSTETYDTHPQKSRVTPSVEVLNTVTNTSDYYPLADTTASYSGIAFDKTSPSNRWKLVTPPVGATTVDVVALLSTVNNNNTVAVYYRYQTVGEYTATILPHSVLAKDASARKEMDIVAYQLPLLAVQATAAGVPVVGHYLDVVEIHTVVEVTNFNRNFLLTQNKTEQGYFSFGIKALTSVASRAGRTPWVETNIPLTSSQKPIPVILQGLGIRQHVSLQNATAIHSLRFRQTPTTTNFVAEVDSSRVLEAHTGFDRVSTRGAGVWAKPVVVEDGTVTAALVSNQNYEATMAPIVYSFIGQTSGGEKKWLTAQTPGTILVERTPSLNYAFMGKVPALIAAEGSKLLFWSNQGNGAFVSSNQGASWTEFNNAPVFYKQERPASSVLNVLGYSNISLNQDNFREGTFVNGVFTVEVKLDNQVKTFNFNTGTTAANYQLTDNILYTLKPSTDGNAYVSSGEQAGYGLNSLSLHSPRQILAWDIDSENRYETIGRYTTAIATPLDTKYNFDNYLFNVSGNLIDFSRDVRYLGYRHWVLVDDAGVYKLHFTNGVVPEKTIEMFGSTTNIALAAFKPEVNFHLWDYLDAAIGYIPYVFYHNSKVVILSRLNETNEFTADLFVLAIPGDNGNPLKPIKMYTANRRDYLFFQKGNGIFKLTYAYNGVDGVTTVGLEEVFDLTAGAQAQLEIFSGAIHGIAAQDAPQETDVPDNLPLGYYIGKECGANYTMLHRYADGNGGFTVTEEINSEECGFIPESDVTGGTAFFEGTSMTFAWQTHAGDRAGVRLSFVPKLADVVPISVEVVLPIADTVDLDYGNIVMAARLPLFYWKTDISGEQPLQRGANTINAPKGATMLELGVHRNVQKQIIDNEYVYNDDSGTGQAILKKVIFKTSVPNSNTNMPRYGDRDYEIDITRITTRKPWVAATVEQSQSVVNAEVMLKTVILRFNNPLPFPARFLIADAMNRAIGNDSMARLGSLENIDGKIKLGILNNPAVQGEPGVLPSSAYNSLSVSRSSSSTGDLWSVCAASTYPLAGEFFNKPAFLVTQGSRAIKFEYRYNRLVTNSQIQGSGYSSGWERVYLHFAKIWRNTNNIGKNYRDSFTEILEPNYVVM